MKLYVKLIEKELKYRSEEDQLSYLKRVIPGLENAYGVKAAKITVLAKKVKAKLERECISPDDQRLLISYLLASGVHEKIILAVEMLSLGEFKEVEDVVDMIDMSLPAISNWGVCDTVANRVCKSMASLRSVEEADFDYMMKPKLYMMVRSTNAWSIRLALVISIWAYCKEENFDFLQDLITMAGNSEDYYVKMAIAWLVSGMYHVNKRKTKKLINSPMLSKWCKEKSLQKIKESRKQV